MGKAFAKTASLLLAASALAACATHPRLPPPSPIAPTQQPAASGIYKVGNPYQVEGVWYYPREQPGYDETGIASWYGSDYHGKLTADGEVFDRTGVSGAHPTLPLPANVRVTNLENGRSMVVRVNDRGPFINGRIIDLSEHAADLLGFRQNGTARVRVTLLGRADLYGPGPAPPNQETPPEVAIAVAAAPSAQVTSAELPPVVGTKVAPPAMAANLPRPLPQDVPTVRAEVPDGQVVQLAVPPATV